jgi:hypothetical protein
MTALRHAAYFQAAFLGKDAVTNALDDPFQALRSCLDDVEAADFFQDYFNFTPTPTPKPKLRVDPRDRKICIMGVGGLRASPVFGNNRR